jgi:hypothetical protein
MQYCLLDIGIQWLQPPEKQIIIKAVMFVQNTQAYEILQFMKGMNHRQKELVNQQHRMYGRG